MGDFPDRDEWTDRRDFMMYGPTEMPKCEACGLPLYKEMIGIDFWIKGYQTCKCEGKKEYADKVVADHAKKVLAAQAEEAMEAAEWDALGETDLIDPNELKGSK